MRRLYSLRQASLIEWGCLNLLGWPHCARFASLCDASLILWGWPQSLMPAASSMYVIMLLRLTLLVKRAHSFKMASLIHKIILDYQDFCLTTEAWNQTSCCAIKQFMSACHQKSWLPPEDLTTTRRAATTRRSDYDKVSGIVIIWVSRAYFSEYPY